LSIDIEKNNFFLFAGMAGFEPATIRLTVEGSAFELHAMIYV
jgi:hypothetical protein